MNDILFNTISPLVLLALAVRSVIALDDRFFSRATFCFFLALLILRLMLQRWFSGLTSSGIKPDSKITGFLSDPTLLNMLVVGFAASVIWTTTDEYFHARSRRRLEKLAGQNNRESALK